MAERHQTEPDMLERKSRIFDLTTEPKTTEQDALVEAYARVFTGPDGERVLADLERLAFTPGISTADPDPNIAMGIAYKHEMLKVVHRNIKNGSKR
jgi:hypothetical protein